eukprot:gene16823-17003_t
MQDIIHMGAGLLAICNSANITIYKTEPRPLLGAHELANVIKIVLVAGGKIIESDNCLVQFQQSLK